VKKIKILNKALITRMVSTLVQVCHSGTRF